MLSIDPKSYSVYFVTTPRHWWLSIAILDANAPNNIVVIFNGFSSAYDLYKILNESRIFKGQVYLAPGSLSSMQYSGFKKFYIRKTEWYQVKKFLKKLSDNYSINEIHTANLTSSQVQFMYSMLGDKAGFVVLDDGLKSYHQEKNKKKNWLSLTYARVFHGFKVYDVENNSILPYFKKGYFVQPDLVDERFESILKLPINRACFNKELPLEMRDKVLDKVGFCEKNWQKKKIVIVFTKVELLERHCLGFDFNLFKRKVYKFINDSCGGYDHIFVKYHPREKDKDVYGLLESYSNIYLIPHGVPFELLQKDITYEDIVVGEVSTILFDIALSKPSTKVISLGCAGKGNDAFDSFRKVGIEIL